MAEPESPESRPLASSEIRLGEQASVLRRQADAVFDGQNLTLGFVEMNEDRREPNADEKQKADEKKKRQADLVKKLNGLTDKDDNPILGREMTVEEIAKLPEEVQKLLGPDGSFAGIYANFLGDPQKKPEASSLAMVVFLDYLRANPEKSPQELLQGAYERVVEVLQAYGMEKDQLPNLAMALVGKDGQVFALNTGGQEIVIIDASGKARKIGETKDQEGKITVDSSQKINKGEKIILCSSEAGKKIDENIGKKPVGEILTALVEENDPSAAGGKGEEQKKEQLVSPKSQTQEPGDRRFIFPRYENAAQIITADEFMKLYPQYIETAQRIFEKVKSKIPKNSGETDEAWQLRVWQEIGKRLSLPGFYTKRDDEIYSMLVADPEFVASLKDSHYILMATEALQIQLKKQINEQYRQRHEADLKKVFRGDVKTVVSHVGEPAYIEGDFDHYFDEQGKIKEGPAKDLLAFDLVADRLLDVPFEVDSSGKAVTYRERMRQLMAIIDDPQKSQEERERASRQLVGLRSNFYSLAIEAIRTRNQPQFINPNPEERQGREKILGEMYAKLEEVSKMDINQLIEQYQGVMVGLSERNKSRIRSFLTKELPYLFDYALKGGDLMKRRISYELKLPYEIDERIHYKRFVQGPTSLEELATGVESPEKRRRIQGEATGKGNDEASEQPTAPPGERRGEEKGEGGGGQEGGPETPPPAPVEEGVGKQPPPPQSPPEALKTEFSFAIVADPTRVQEEVGALARHYRASEKPTLGWKILLHPGAFIKNMWQNTFFSRIFDDQAIRFEMGLTEAVRRRLGLDSSVPIQMTAELMDKALEEADKLRKKRSFGRKLVDFFRDIPANVLGIGQNSRMRLAREWLEREAPEELFQGVKKVSFEDQTAFAQRFTLEERGGLKPISEEIGERRYLLSERSPEHNTALQGKIKELAAAVCTGQKTREQALVEFNKYFREQIYPNLPSDIQKELSGVELSSNLLALIDYLQKTDSSGETYYQRYQKETGEGGKTKWDELQVKIYLGKGRYETARGDTELTLLQRKLIDRMMKRNYEKETGFRFSDLPRGVELAKDALLYGGSFLSGGLLGLATRVGGRIPFIFGLQLNPLTAMLSTSLVAASREGVVFAHHGRLKGIVGKAWQDFVQVSREAAQGRKGIEGANLRKQFEALLVSSESAENLTAAITNLLQKDNLTEAEQKQLLLAIAHAQARLRMTDLSVRRGKRFLGMGDIEVPQNFITYHSDKRNEELTALHSAILEGMAKLTGVNSDLAQKLEEVTSIYMAQLRVGSTREKLAQAITLNNPNISSADAQRLVDEVFNQFGEAVNLKIAEEKSLEGSVARLAALTWRRAGQTFVMSAVYGGIAKVTLTPVIGEGMNIIHDIHHAGGVLKGLSEYVSDWQQVVSGDVPIEVVNGHPVVDLSPLQGGYLSAKYYWHDFMGLFNHHLAPITETFNLSSGSHLELTNGIHIQQGDFNSDGYLDTIIIDKHHPTEILGWFNGQHLDVSDYNNDGIAELVFVDRSGQAVDATSQLRQLGIKIAEIQIPAGTTTETIFSLPAGVGSHEEVVGGIIVHTPNGTHWVDNHNGTYDLVGKDVNGDDVVLIDDASVQGNNLIITKVHPGLSASLNPISQSERVETGEAAASFWEKILQPRGKEVWWTNRTVGSDYQELRLYNSVYQDANGNYGIVFYGPTGQGSIDGSHFYPVEQVASQNGGMQLGLFVPGLGNLKIDMSCDGRGGHDFWLDTANNNEVLSGGQPVIMPDGHHLTVGELARMLINQERLREHLATAGMTVGSQPVSLATEYRGWHDVFNLGIDGRNGYIVAGFTDKNGVFNHLATIRGSGDLSWVTGGESAVNLGLTGEIVREVARFTSVIKLTPPEITYNLPSLWFIPVRENIERSTKGEEGKVTPPSAQPTPPPSQPPQTQGSSSPVSSPPVPASFTSEQIRALEEERDRLVKEIAALRQKPNPSEEDKKVLAEKEKQLAEIEAQLTPPETKPKIEVTKEEFEKEMQQIVDLLKTKSLDEINQILVSLGVEKLKDQSELDNLRKDENQLRIKALEIELARIKEDVITAMIEENQEEFEQIWREEESKLSQSDKQKLAYYQELERRANEISAQIKQLKDEGQKNSLNQRLTQVTQEAQKLFPEIQPLVLAIEKQARERFYKHHKGEIDSEFERIKRQIEEWERVEQTVVSPEVREHHPKEVAGHSEKGKRDKDEDAYFDGDFHFGESTITEDLLRRIGVLEPNETLAGLKDRLKQSGLSVSIVADGMGGHGNGEIASAIAVVGLIKQLNQLTEINEESLRKAITAVDQYIGNYNQKNNVDSGATLVAQITDKDGNTWVVSVGDSRVYRIDPSGECQLVTYDQSVVWALMSAGGITPEQIFADDRKNIILSALHGKRKLDERKIQVYNLGSQLPNSYLVLCCDGVWEGINSSNISQDLVNQFNKMVEALVQSGKTLSEARKIAAQEFFGQVFFQLNLGGDIKNLNPVYLTREEVTNFSGDNATAVVVKF
jgi:protein phosphatase